ncbi:MAG: hypothetical protein ACJAV6_000333 [Candidatus Paceibacteria bacterium]|jgi:hypothetical protein
MFWGNYQVDIKPDFSEEVIQNIDRQFMELGFVFKIKRKHFNKWLNNILSTFSISNANKKPYVFLK